MNVNFGKPKKNMKKVEKLIKQTSKKGVDVIVLPETWNTGFFPKNVTNLADEDGKKTKDLLSKLSKKFNTNIVGGSVANKIDNKIMNTSYVFNRKGSLIAEYNKTHLFTHMGEDDYFTPGDYITTFELDGIRCGLAICYEIRFPEIFRTLAFKNSLINFVPTEWPLKRKDHWRTLLKARAIENQNFIVGVNASGVVSGDLKLAGHSSCIDPWGKRLVEANENEEILITEIDLSIIDDIRSSINVFEDRKPKLYEL